MLRFFPKIFIYLFIYLFIWLHPVLVSARGIFSAACRIFCCSVWALHCGAQASLVVAHRLSCLAACGILVSQPGIEPTSAALEGRFLTTGPPVKSRNVLIN